MIALWLLSKSECITHRQIPAIGQQARARLDKSLWKGAQDKIPCHMDEIIVDA